MGERSCSRRRTDTSAYWPPSLARIVPEQESREHGILLYWPSPAYFKSVCRDAAFQRTRAKLKALKLRACDMQRAVLVHIREFMKMPERTLGTLPCEPRLRELDQGHRALVNA